MESDPRTPDDDSWWYLNRQRKTPIDDEDVRSFLRRLSAELAEGREFAVVIASDDALRQANRRFRGQAGSTDVLSFPDDDAGRLGDILISARRAEQQAARYGHSPTDEVKTLILHGLLHLLGYDHHSDDGRMRDVEERLRRRYGLSTSLIARAAS